MSKSSAAANVVDLEAFRQQRRLRDAKEGETPMMMPAPRVPAMMVPVWFCWVPVWPLAL